MPAVARDPLKNSMGIAARKVAFKRVAALLGK